MLPPRFNWDAGNREKCRKHGVSTAEIEAMLQRPFGVFPDPEHSGNEERFKAVGTNDAGRYIFASSPSGQLRMGS